MMRKTLLSVFTILFIAHSHGDEVRITNVESYTNFMNSGSTYSGTTVFLDSDLSLTGCTIATISSFRGIFDGQGYMISNLIINSSSSTVTGIFEYSSGLTIRNVILDSSCSITNTYSGSSNLFVGGIIGECYPSYGQCNIENNVNMGSVTFNGSISSYDLHLGGIAGYLHSLDYNIYVKNCANYGSVTHSGTSSFSYIGGIVGYLYNSYYKYIYNCLNYGTITHSGTTSSALYLGGIAGCAYHTYIENCVSAGTISSPRTAKYVYIGSLVGSVSSYTYINYCYYTDELSNFKLYGDGTPISTSNTLSYNNSTFELDGIVYIENYSGISLIGALNASSDYYILRDYSHWMLNKNNKTVSFTVNDRTNSIEMDYRIILLPSLASDGNISFDGWYNDSEYESLLTVPEVTSDTSLYGKFVINTNNYTISFDTRGGTPVDPISAQFGTTVSLPSNLTRDRCTFISWETEKRYKIRYNFTVHACNITLYAVWECTHIKIPNDFLVFMDKVNSGSTYSGTTVFLGSDLSLSGYNINPIGISSSYQFRGVFDGKGYVISNITISSPSQYMGLFGYSYGLTIRNVILDSSCSITNTYSGSIPIYIGGIIGYCISDYGQCSIENNVNMASVTFSGSISNNLYLGGIAGYLESYSKYHSIYAKNCANYGSVTHSGISYNSYIGGIVGEVGSLYTYYKYIYNCFNYGTIKRSGTTSYYLCLGGIVGYTGHTYIENCVSAGMISSNNYNYIGSIVGEVDSEVYINYCYYTSDVGASNLCGGSVPTSITNSHIVDLNATTMAELNEYAEKNSTWSKWKMLHLWGGNVNNLSQETLVSNQNYFPDPEREGYKFLFWCIDEECGNQYIYKSTNLDEVTDFYAHWTINNYTLTFIFDNGTESEVRILNFSQKIEYPADPERENYTFNGWDNKLDTMPANDTTITALWINNYTLTFVFGNGTEPEVRILNYSQEIIYPENVQKEGYIFDGWDKKPNTMPANDTYITALWTANNYTVTFNATGGDVTPLSKEVTYDSIYGVLPTPTRVGYGFNGWFTEEDGKGDKITESTTVKITRNQTLYANWTAGAVTVTFNATGGISSLASKSVVYDGEYGELPAAEKEGYTFAGWFTEEEGGNNVENTTRVTNPEPHTLYAQWIINNYTLTFVFNNGTEPEVRILNYSQKIEYPKDVQKEGYSFYGWNNKPVTMPADDTTIIALWTANNYTITFNATGGDVTLSSKEVTFNTSYGKLPEPNKTGYTFIGWYICIFSGEKVNSSSIMDTAGNHTIYAHWSINNYSLIFIFNNGTEPVVRILNYNQKIIYPENVQKEGYTFEKWDNNITNMPAHNLTVTALWYSQAITIVFSTVSIDEDVKQKIIKVFNTENSIIEFVDNKKDGTVMCIIKFVDKVEGEELKQLVNKVTSDNDIKTAIENIEVDGEKWVGKESSSSDSTTTIVVVVVVVIVVIVALVAILGFFMIGKKRVNESKKVKKTPHTRIMGDDMVTVDAIKFSSRFKREKIYPKGYVPPDGITDPLLKAGFNEEVANEVVVACESVVDNCVENDHVIGNFTSDDAAAVCMYTFDFGEESNERSPYILLNEALRAERDKTEEIVKVRDILYLVMCALRKLPAMEGVTLYRGFRKKVDESLYKEGSAVVWPGFSSTTTNMNAVKGFLGGFNGGSNENGNNDGRRYEVGKDDKENDIELEGRSDSNDTDNCKGTLFIIENGWGYNVQPYSFFPEEEEILLEPEREFEVVSVIDSGDLLLVTLNMKKTITILDDVFGKVNKE